jgi:hypothetical protein
LLERKHYFNVSARETGAEITHWSEFEAWLELLPADREPETVADVNGNTKISPPAEPKPKSKTGTLFSRKSPERESKPADARKRSFPSLLNRLGSGQDQPKMPNGAAAKGGERASG